MINLLIFNKRLLKINANTAIVRYVNFCKYIYYYYYIIDYNNNNNKNLRL